MDIEKLVSSYVALRDKKATIKAEYDGKVEKVDEMLKKVEGVLLNHFNEVGVESVSTKAGTAYKSARSSATVADWDLFLAHVQRTESWELLEHRASKKAVEEHKAANDDLPPGISWSSEVVVNIRRSK